MPTSCSSAEVDGEVGRGWATVELERAAVEHARDLVAGTSFEPARRSEVLGARCLRGRAADGSGWVVLLEPDSEGLISGYLARHGEGWAATWTVTPAAPGMQPGPLGDEAADRAGGTSRWGPFRLRVVPATIDP